MKPALQRTCKLQPCQCVCCTGKTCPGAVLLMCALGHGTSRDVYSLAPFGAPTPVQHNYKLLVTGTNAPASTVVTSHPTTHTYGLVRPQTAIPTFALVALVANGQPTHAVSTESFLHHGKPAQNFPPPPYTHPVAFRVLASCFPTCIRTTSAHSQPHIKLSPSVLPDYCVH